MQWTDLPAGVREELRDAHCSSTGPAAPGATRRRRAMNSDKIRPEHLRRTAFIYVRQSTLDQVRHYHESRRRQYDLAAHARTMGWTQIVVVDEDLGKSGATAAGRPGFQRLVAEVSLGRVGAVFGLEVSRLARNNRDWYQLLDLCGLMGTLIIDAEGVYEPRSLNDRLLLGLKGTMSEAELGWIRQRAHEGLLAKARRGELILSLPVGYVQTRDGRVEKHPDQRVQHAIARVFTTFAELGSVRQTLLWFRQERLTLPSIERDPAWGVAVGWRAPVYNTILKFLTNPSMPGPMRSDGPAPGRRWSMGSRARRGDTGGPVKSGSPWSASTTSRIFPGRSTSGTGS